MIMKKIFGYFMVSALAIVSGWSCAVPDEPIATVMEPKAVNIPPTSARSYYDRGRELALRDRPADALLEFKEAIKLEPEFVEAHQEYIDLMLTLGKQAEIQAEYKEFLNARPDKALAHYLYSKTLGDPEALRKENEKAIQIDPGFSYAYGGLAFYYVQSGNYEKAFASGQKMVEFNPRYARGYYILGILYAQKGDHDKAIENFRKSVELDPLLADSYRCLSGLYSAKKNYDGMIQSSTSILEIDKRPAARLDGYLNLGVAYVGKGEFGLAKDNFIKAAEIARSEKSPEACFMIAQVFCRIKEYDPAIAILEDGLKYNPAPLMVKQIQVGIEDIKKHKNK
jgi:tetratricopeptide (TPR) repeat protein